MTDDAVRRKDLAVPADLLERVTSLGKANHRSANAEIVVAIERHVQDAAIATAEDAVADHAPTRKARPNARKVTDPHRRT